MKTKSTLVAGLVVLLSTIFFAGHAQTTNPAIKVLPTTKDGILKLLVVGTTDEPVDVKFYSQDGLAGTDEVQSTDNGFNKRYDIRRIMNENFTMEVTTAGTSVTYKLARENGKMMPYLVKTTYTYPLVASKD